MGYYRKFIKGFSKVALPLRKFLIGLESQGKKAAKHTLVDWGEEEQNAFDTLKSLCCKAPILAYPNYKLPFILHTDSSLKDLELSFTKSRMVSKESLHMPLEV